MGWSLASTACMMMLNNNKVHPLSPSPSLSCSSSTASPSLPNTDNTPLAHYTNLPDRRISDSVRVIPQGGPWHPSVRTIKSLFLLFLLSLCKASSLKASSRCPLLSRCSVLIRGCECLYFNGKHLHGLHPHPTLQSALTRMPLLVWGEVHWFQDCRRLSLCGSGTQRSSRRFGLLLR